jgi:beta-lactamase regulating signal transducer with metallopeptidase domain
VSWIAVLAIKPLVLFAAATAIAGLLRRQAAAVRHAVWTGALLASLLLAPLSLLLPPLRIPIIPEPLSRAPSGWMSIRAASPTPAPRSRVPAGGRALISASYSDSEDGNPAIVVLALAWLAGILLLTGRRLRAEARARRLPAGATTITHADTLRILAREVAALGIRNSPEVLACQDLAVPAVIGLFRPKVLLPPDAATWSAPDLTAVLAHELGHIKRRDCLINLLADCAVILLWWNPALHLIRRRIRSESERACDDLALLRGAEPQGYARLLLAAARAAQRLPLPATVAAMARPRELESRLLAVLDDRLSRRSSRPGMTGVLVGVILLATLPLAAFSLQAPPGSAEPRLPEPDRRGDWVAAPESERLPVPDGRTVPPAALEALAGPDSALTARLIAALDHVPKGPSDLIRERAAWALGQARNGLLVEPLLALLADPDWRVQSYAAWALATARDPRAVPALLPLLEHPVWRLRAMAAYALREAADPRGIRLMTAALSDPAWQVRLEAVGYFISLGGPDMAERVRARRNDRHIAVRLAARASSPPF